MMAPKYQNATLADRGHFKPVNPKDATEIHYKDVTIPPKDNKPLHPTFTITLDTEFRTDKKQRLRAEYFELRGMWSKLVEQRIQTGEFNMSELDTLVDAGFVLGDEADELHPGDLQAIRNYAAENSFRGQFKNVHIKVLTKQQFIRNVFYRYCYNGYCPGGTKSQPEYARCVGMNLPVDLSRLITRHTAARGDYDGGFTFLFCDCEHGQTGPLECSYHPPLRMKKIGRSKFMYTFRLDQQHTKDGTWVNSTTYGGSFVDVATFGNAIAPNDKPIDETIIDSRTGETKHVYHGPQSLAAMCRQFKVEAKLDSPDFSGPIDKYYLDYLVQDVRSTYFLFRELRNQYLKYNFNKKPDYIYSQASMPKALLEELGIPPYYAGDRNNEYNVGWNISDEVRGYIAAALHGGRSEIGIRLMPVESILLDFTSEYPLVNNLLNLQEFWMNDNVEACESTLKARDILASNNLMKKLQNKNFWKKLRMIVAVKDVPEDNPIIVPGRSKYNGQTYNEALPYMIFRGERWYTLLDIIGSVILTEHIPNISKAYEFKAVGSVRKTNTIRLMGDDKYTIDLTKDDLYTQLIDKRQEIKEQIETSDNPDLLKGLEVGFKLIANSGSYGIQLEQNPKERASNTFKLRMYSTTGQSEKPVNAKTFDEPGRYFAGPISCLIPAGGRLLLALCERLAHDKGLHYAFMDTDSICVARPLKTLGQMEISRDEFRKRVSEIADYFKPLNPYAHSDEVLKWEKVNYVDNDKRNGLRTLYCIAVSSKRYVLYEKNNDRTYTIVKVSSHGLGGWSISNEYKIPSNIPPKPQKLDCNNFIYTLWYDFVWTLDTGYYHAVDGRTEKLKANNLYYPQSSLDPGLDQLAYAQYTLSHPSDMKRFKFDDEMTPFNFITVIPKAKNYEYFGAPRAIDMSTGLYIADVDEFDGTIYDNASTCYTEFCNNEAKLKEMIAQRNVFRFKDGKRITNDDKFDTLETALMFYFQHDEAKAVNGTEIGIMLRRYIRVNPIVKVVGKESNRIALDNMEDTAGIIGSRMGATDVDEYSDLIEYGEVDTAPNIHKVSDKVIAMFKKFSIADIMSASGLNRNQIINVNTNPTKIPAPHILQALEMAQMLLHPDTENCILNGWKTRVTTPKQLAKILDVDMFTSEKLYSGKLMWRMDYIQKLTEYLESSIVKKGR